MRKILNWYYVKKETEQIKRLFNCTFPMPGVKRQGVSDAKLNVLGGVYKRQEAFI